MSSELRNLHYFSNVAFVKTTKQLGTDSALHFSIKMTELLFILTLDPCQTSQLSTFSGISAITLQPSVSLSHTSHSQQNCISVCVTTEKIALQIFFVTYSQQRLFEIHDSRI